MKATALLLTAALAAIAACDPLAGPHRDKCEVLCQDLSDPDSRCAGEPDAVTACLDECDAMTRDLDSACAQCVVEQSQLEQDQCEVVMGKTSSDACHDFCA